MSLGEDYFEMLNDPITETALDRDQATFDIEFYNAVLKRNKNHVDVLRRLVEIHARRDEHQVALKLDQRLVRLRPLDCIAHYNLACSLSVLGDVEAAIEALDRAMQLGYRDIAHMETDPDVESLRRHPGYRRLLNKHGLLD